MISLKAMVSVPFFKKARFTGSWREMHYALQKVSVEEEGDFLEGVVWQGPYNSEVTPETAKIRARFPFSEEGIGLAVEWLNQQYETGEWRRQDSTASLS